MAELGLMQHKISTSRGHVVYYVSRSFPSRPFVVLLHGLTANHTTWLNIIEPLQALRYNIIAPDLRGHGHSDKTIEADLYTPDRLAQDVHLIMQREGVRSCSLVGYSFGGTVALNYAMKYPEAIESFVLISTNHMNPLRYKRIGWMSPALAGFAQLLAKLFSGWRRKRYEYYQHRKSEPRGYWYTVYVGLKTMPLSVNLWLISYMLKLNLRPMLRPLNVPTLIIRSRHDPFLSLAEARDLATLLKAKLITAKSDTHFLASVAQDEVAGILLTFLETACA